jgi:hypothetical protein
VFARPAHRELKTWVLRSACDIATFISAIDYFDWTRSKVSDTLSLSSLQNPDIDDGPRSPTAALALGA